MRLRRWSVAAALSLAVLSGCRDGLGARLQGASVRIFIGSVTFSEQTIQVGTTLVLRADVLDTTGRPIPEQTIEWSSDTPAVATVDGAGVVTAVSVGTARVVAMHRSGADTAKINVAEPITGTASCEEGDDLALQVGEVRVLPGDEAVLLCLPGGGSGAEYTVLLHNSGSSAAATLQTQIRGTGLIPVTGPPVPALIPAPVEGEPAQDGPFHRWIREEVSARLESRLRGGIDPGDFLSRSPQLAVDQVLRFNVETASGNGCSNPDFREGRIRWIGSRAVVVADVENPTGGFTDADYRQFGEFFDREAWPLVTGAFGEPSDIDRNGKVILFFTRAVNQRAENADDPRGGGDSYVAGFFFNRDLFPRIAQRGVAACEGSNESEMFYMLVPDPLKETPGARAFSREFVARSTRTVLVHEFQHLVNDSRRLHVNRAPVWEETWLNEGLSHAAEELMFYRRAGLPPGRNLRATDFTTPASQEAFRLFQLDNLNRFTLYLRNPEGSSLMGPDQLTTRGAAWSFLRYAADRRGANEAQFWRALVADTRSAGLENLRQALGGDPQEWMREWALALYLDDTGLDTDPRYRIASWNHRALYPQAGSFLLGTQNQAYPLRAPRINNEPATQLALQGGGAAYLRAGVLAGRRGVIRTTIGPPDGPQLPPPSRLHVIITRTK